MMSTAQARTWARLIRAGRRTIDDVPENLREQVKELLEAI